MTTTPSEPTGVAGKTWKPTTAGILSIIAGCIGIGAGALVATIGGLVGQFVGMAWLGAIGTPLIVFGIIAIIGGVFALRRRIWGLALAGSILATPCMPILGILSIIFVALGKQEFSQS